MSDTEEKDSFRPKKGIAATHTHDYSGVPTADYDDERVEKPWQRVPSTILILVLGVYLLLGYLTQVVEMDMPNALSESVAENNSLIFSEEVARRYLERIVGDAPRVAGTPYHLTKTRDLKALVDEIAASATQPVKTDWQTASGDSIRVGKTTYFSVYRNVSNVVALLEGENGFHNNGTLDSAILVNCHYDSVPFALGASDNAAFCAIMAEILTQLSRSNKKLKRNVVFLFNGAEENGLQASHGFLQHPWFKGVRIVINLDAAGMNGKPTIFQVSDPRVLNAYQESVSIPNAQGLAEFLFESGIIPSDTDFRIWRDFGHVHGIDIAFVKYALVYHTRNDKPELILPGVLQCAGDMLQNTIVKLSENSDFEVKLPPQTAVYYDYLNLFMVTYSIASSFFIDFVISALGVGSVYYYVWLVGNRWSTIRKLLIVALGRVICLLAGVLTVTIFTLIMVATTVQMRYLPQPWLVIPLYWLPYLIAAVATSHLFDAWFSKKNGLSRSLRTLQAMAATRLHLSVILFILICLPRLTSTRYLFSAPLLIMAFTSIISITVVRFVTLQGWQHLLLEVCLSLPSVMFMFSLSLRVNAQMLPIMNRSGGDLPDYTAAAINVFLAALISSTISGIELLFSRKRLWMVLCAVGAVCVVLMFIPFSPYEDDGLSVQRHYWFHSELVSFDINNNVISRTSGIVVTKHDPYSTDAVVPALTSHGYNVNVHKELAKDCEEQVFCGLPVFRTVSRKTLPQAIMLYTGPPAPFSPPVSLTANKSCSGDVCHFNFVFNGGNHNIITLWPHTNVSLTSWSLQSAPDVSFVQSGRPVYVVYHSTATYTNVTEEVTFNVTFNVPQSLQSQPIVDLSHHSHKIYSPEDFTEEYKKILEIMPPYFNIATFLSFRHNYVF